MGVIQKKIAVLCNYELVAERVGGMDYFFWAFDEKCRKNNILIDWFFPNSASHGSYSKLNIISSNHQEVELYFANYIQDKSLDYSFVITHFVELCTSIFKSIKQYSKAQIIAVDHNPRPLNGYSFLKTAKKKVKGFLYAKYVDVFVGVSEYSKNQLVIDFGSRILNKTIVISNGLQFDKFIKKTNYNFQNKFLIASHLRKDKGIQDVIEAVANLSKKNDYNFSIDVFGSGYYEAFLKKLCSEFKVEKFFVFKGSVSNLNEIYSNYDYLIHPSHGETFCYSVVEALVCNLPVITTKNQGNVLGLVHDNFNGFLFEEGNTSALETILNKVIRHQKQLNAALDFNAKITDFTLEKMVDSYYNLIQ